MTRVLIVDDSQTVLSFLQAVLEGAHYDVSTASDGADALAQVQQAQPDIVVTDAIMPGVSGFGLLRALRSDPATASIPVIILTSSDPQDPDTVSQEPQPDALVRKSPDFGPLLAEIRDCLSRRR